VLAKAEPLLLEYTGDWRRAIPEVLIVLEYGNVAQEKNSVTIQAQCPQNTERKFNLLCCQRETTLAVIFLRPSVHTGDCSFPSFPDRSNCAANVCHR